MLPVSRRQTSMCVFTYQTSFPLISYYFCSHGNLHFPRIARKWAEDLVNKTSSEKAAGKINAILNEEYIDSPSMDQNQDVSSLVCAISNFDETQGHEITSTQTSANKIEPKHVTDMDTFNTSIALFQNNIDVNDFSEPQPRLNTDISLRSVNCSTLPITYRSKLPSIFTPFAPHLDVLDFNYLSIHDALTAPSEALQLKLLQNYVSYIHPHLPFLNLKDFLGILGYRQFHHCKDQMSTRGSPAQISFLLFQAVIFAGSTVTDSETLREAGYSNRSEVEMALFRRVRLLHDFDTCSDRLSLLQTLVLMSYVKMDTPDGKGHLHWLGLAVSLALSMGLHRKSTQRAISPEEQRLKRRLWWCIFLLDRTTALNTRQDANDIHSDEYDQRRVARPVLCRQEDCDTPMLCWEDFEPCCNHMGTEGERSSRDHEQRFTEKVLLSWCTTSALISNCCMSLPATERNFEPARSTSRVDEIAGSSGAYLDLTIAGDVKADAFLPNDGLLVDTIEIWDCEGRDLDGACEELLTTEEERDLQLTLIKELETLVEVDS